MRQNELAEIDSTKDQVIGRYPLHGLQRKPRTQNIDSEPCLHSGMRRE